MNSMIELSADEIDCVSGADGFCETVVTIAAGPLLGPTFVKLICSK